MAKCPCCNQDVDRVRGDPSSLSDIGVSMIKRAIIDRLTTAYPGGATVEELLEYVYRGARRPKHAGNALAVQISLLRHELALYGWTIPREPGGAGCPAYYRLMRMAGAKRLASGAHKTLRAA